MQYLSGNLLVVFLGLCLGVILILIYGFLFNYAVIQELKTMNNLIIELTDVLGANLSRMNRVQQQSTHQPYQLKNENSNPTNINS